MASRTPGSEKQAKEDKSYRESWMTTMALLTEGYSLSGNERNCSYLNVPGGKMVNISAVSGFDAMDDSRGIALTDWDHDGDVDMWLSNRTSPAARFYRNTLPLGTQHFLALRLKGTKSNRDAIGARASVHIKGRSVPLLKTVRAGDGFLSQSSRWLHFGLGQDQEIERVEIRWPSGGVQTLGSIKPDQRYLIIEGESEAKALPPRAATSLKPQPLVAQPLSNAARVPLYTLAPLPAAQVVGLDGAKLAVPSRGSTRPSLLMLWTSWCPNCAAELKEFTQEADDLRKAGIDVLAINLDIVDKAQGSEKAAREALRKLNFPFPAAFGSQDLIDQWEVFQRTLIHTHLTLPVPASFLVDAQGRAAAIYKGPVKVSQVIRDLSGITAQGKDRLLWAEPFHGPRIHVPQPIDPIQVALKFFEGGYDQHSRNYLRQLIEIVETKGPGHELLKREELHYMMATMLEGAGNATQAAQAYQYLLSIAPKHRNALVNLARLMAKQNQFPSAADLYEKAIALDASDFELRLERAEILLRLGQRAKAEQETLAVLKAVPKHETAKKLLELIRKH